MLLKGQIWRFGDDVDTDVIMPARYLSTSDPNELARHCMEDLDPTFHLRVQPGEIIVAGKNFGCGSSREHAPIAIKAVGISTVIAGSFARIFYRNAINIGLPIFESPEAAAAAQQGDVLEVDADQGIIRNLTRNTSYTATPFPPFMQKLIKAGGLMGYVREQLAISR